jgi:hypothetical protein
MMRTFPALIVVMAVLAGCTTEVGAKAEPRVTVTVTHTVIEPAPREAAIPIKPLDQEDRSKSFDDRPCYWEEYAVKTGQVKAKDITSGCAPKEAS